MSDKSEGLTIDWTHTERGFVLGRFTDWYNASCSIQESSLASDDAIWLGRGEHRMHLNVEQAIDLIDVLERFVADGDLRAFSKAAAPSAD